MHTDGNANLAVEMGVLKYSHPKYYAKHRELVFRCALVLVYSVVSAVR
jgi:hypothetical protein